MNLSRQRMLTISRKNKAFSPKGDPNLVWWYDTMDRTALFQNTAKTTSVSANNDPIRVLVDKSGNGHDAVAPSDSKRPLYKKNIFNSHPVIKGDRIDDTLTISSFHTGIHPTTGSFYLAAVLRNTESASWNAFFGFGSANAPDMSIYNNNMFMAGWDAGYPSATNVANNTNYIYEYFRNGGQVYRYLNGTLIEQYANSSSLNDDAIMNICSGSPTAHFSDLYIGEVMFYKAMPLDRVKVYNYINKKWAPFDTNLTYRSYFLQSNHNETGLLELRETLITKIWPNGYPSAGMDTTTSGIADPLTTSPTNLDHVDSHTITLTNPDTAATINPIRTIHVWHPTNPNGIFVIFHRGHSDTWNEIGMNTTIKALVETGYTVGGVTMPMEPDDTQTLHNGIMYDANDATEIHWFVDPAIRLINEYSSTFQTFYMTGISGGGWTTAVLASLEPRISKAIDVAGSLSLIGNPNRSDTEQYLPGLALFVDYTDLYTLSMTANRKFYQILITNDPITFPLTMYNNKQYKPAVQFYKPDYDLFWDSTTNNHEISAYGRQKILDLFAS